MTKKRLKNKILKALAYINGIVLVCAAAGIDSEPLYVPLTLIVITGTWLMLFAYANGYLNINYKEAESNENYQAKRGVHHSDGRRKRVEHHEAAGADRPHLLQVGR